MQSVRLRTDASRRADDDNPVDDRDSDGFLAALLRGTVGQPAVARPITDLAEAIADADRVRRRQDSFFTENLLDRPRAHPHHTSTFGTPESSARGALADAESVDDAEAGISEHQPGHAQRRLDPRYLFDVTRPRPAPVWAESQQLRMAVNAAALGTNLDALTRQLLRDALERQLPTLVLWNHVSKQRAASRAPGADATATLYVILFPGESPDGTGVKQLNDKVLGYDRNTQFIRERRRIVEQIFNGTPGTTGFITIGQDYKTASIVAAGKTRREFAGALRRLDGELKKALLAALKGAEEDAKENKDDDEETRKRKKQRRDNIAAVRKAVNNKDWRFDFLFGAATRRVTDYTDIDIVFLLLTEALKGAGVARFTAKAATVSGRKDATLEVARHRAQPDDEKDDNRGKLFNDSEFLRTLGATAAVRDAMSVQVSTAGSFLIDQMNIYVDGVWTLPWAMYDPEEQRPIANPDVLRDARKRLLADPPLSAGLKLKYSLAGQVMLLELWLTAINTIDLVKDFLVGEFKKELVQYHSTAQAAHAELGGVGRVDGQRLKKLLTRDLRQGTELLSVLGRASEFQFYAHTSDHADRMFFVFDVRDMGVDLLTPYELSADKILWRRLAGRRLLFETFRSSDAVNRRKRATYDAVVYEFRKVHDKVMSDPAWKQKIQRAFGPQAATPEMPSFADSLEVMMGGDEIFVAAHPAYAEHVCEIVVALDKWRDQYSRGLNLRLAVAYSSAARLPSADPTAYPSPDQRQRNARAHDEALALASSAPNTLKEFERTHRRIERLIAKVPRDPRRDPKPDPKRDKEREEKAKNYRRELDALGLMRLYASAKRGRAAPMDPSRLQRLLDALNAGDAQKAKAVADEDFDLVDFQCRPVHEKKLREAASALQKRVEQDARPNNVHFDPPPLLTEKPKLPKWLREYLPDAAYKWINEWYDDDGRKEWEWNPRPDPSPKSP